ncbi:response regulator [Pirellulaceae bacterium]|nr:response regulator [Pirellulaceae bacterium]
MSENKILFVDDDPKVLKAIARQFEDKFDIETAGGPLDGIQVVKERGPIAVVISDMRMPDMTGIEMLTQIKSISPDTVRMMLTGFSDLETTIDAINRGNIFRFLSKPCPNDVLELAMTDGLRQHALIRSEKELVEGTLMGSVKVLSDVLALVNPVAFGRASRVKRIAIEVAKHMQIEEIWEIEIASMLSALGCVTLNESTLQKITSNEELTESERVSFEQHPDIGKRLLENIPRLENVARIVAYQEKHFDGGGFPNDELSAEEIPIGARIVKAALDFDTEENRNSDAGAAFVAQKRNSTRYDPTVLRSLQEVIFRLSNGSAKEISLDEIRTGMVFAKNVMAEKDRLLIAKGHEVTESALKLLKNYASRDVLQLPLWVC